MGSSRNFGSQRQPTGKEFRDSGSLGKAVKDLYSDVDDAFLALEAELGVLPSTTATPIYPTKTNVDVGPLAIGANTLAAGDTFSGRLTVQADAGGGATLSFDTAANLLAALATRKGSAAAVGDTWRLWIHENGGLNTVTLGFGAAGITGVATTAIALTDTIQDAATLLEFHVTGIGGGAAVEIRRVA